MEKNSLDKFMEAAGNVASGAGKMAENLVNKGHDKASELALSARIAKLQRQLGALVYALRKNGEENEAMLQWYVDEIDRLKAQMPTARRAGGGAAGSSVQFYGKEAAEDDEDAMFRDGPGDKFP